VMPPPGAIDGRLDTVLATLYLLFNEGYYAYGRDTTMRRELCLEAMRLTLLLTSNGQTAQPKSFALLALMCFAASRFDARLTEQGEGVVYEEQDTTLWNSELVERGNAYLHIAAQGPVFSRYHLEASIAWWHTGSKDKPDKWKHILRLYDQLLRLENTPMAALNRIYALYQVEGAALAIAEAEKLSMTGNHLYHALLGELYTGIDNSAAVMHLEEAIRRTPSAADKRVLEGKLMRVKAAIILC
jgi:predicted RNA polymerase sigma factor